MIVAQAEKKLQVVTQNDHAHFAGELLSLWRTDSLPRHPRRRELIFAAREHDNGWREADAAPRCHPVNGKPVDFRAIPRELRWEIWRRGTRRFVRREVYAALLIVRHALHLHREAFEDARWAGILTEWRELEAELRDASGVPEESVADDYRWIDLTDSLSLQVVNRHGEPLVAHGFRAEFSPACDVSSGRDILTVEPFPLAGATTLTIPCRRIPDRLYRGDADLGGELATARWAEIVVRVAPKSYT